MLENTDVSSTAKILTTMPCQNFTSLITDAEFSAFSWYQEAIANTSALVLIHKQDDPFKGGLDLALGYAMGFQTGNFRGVFGVMFSTKAMRRIIHPLISRSDTVRFFKEKYI